MNINDLDFQQTTEPQMGYDTVLSAGICDTCSIPKMMNTGDGINEPPDPIIYCQKMKREICPEPQEDRMAECRFYSLTANGKYSSSCGL